MKRRGTTDGGPGEGGKLSRGDIETLCVLHAVGAGGCPAGDLAERLGLSASIAPEIAAGMDSLVNSGLLNLEDGHFSLTDAGRVRLEKRSGSAEADLMALLASL